MRKSWKLFFILWLLSISSICGRGAKDQKLSKFQPCNSSTWIWTPSGNSYQGRVFCIEIDHWKLEFLGFWGRNCHSSLRSSRTAEGGSCTTSVVCVCVCLCVFRPHWFCFLAWELDQDYHHRSRQSDPPRIFGWSQAPRMWGTSL